MNLVVKGFRMLLIVLILLKGNVYMLEAFYEYMGWDVGD